ncbi:RDD family protein [Massilia sp.]|uniref:RDD family protein n=1 Tax=Massilia sp. TaxID=1882437 RepID=UPI0028985FB4|nr:RDD family protein [Massilia sp.]
MQTAESSAAAPAAHPVIGTPTVKRRLIAMVYEAFLLTAVEALAVFVFIFATGNRQEAGYRAALMAFLFLVTAAYFVHAWSGSGFTLAMKTWRIKVVKVGHAKVPFRNAAIRYLLAWGWFAPALAVGALLDLHHAKEWAVALGIGLVAWALTAFLDKDRQFLHDRIAGTRLIALPKKQAAQARAK